MKNIKNKDANNEPASETAGISLGNKFLILVTPILNGNNGMK